MRLLAVFRCRGVDFLQKQIRCKEKCLYLQKYNYVVEARN